MRSVRLFNLEVHRLITRPRFWVMQALVLALGWNSLSQLIQNNQTGQPLLVLRLGGLLTALQAEWLWLIIPILVGVAVAGSLAIDRRQYYLTFLLVRGIGRTRYFLIKAWAMACGAMISVLTSCLLILLLAACYVPVGNTVFLPGRGLDGRTLPPTLPGPLPALAATQPWMNDIAAIGMLVLASAALAMSGLAVSALIANEYLATAVPFVGTLAAIFVLRGPAEILQPMTHLNLWRVYPRLVPAEWQPYAAPLYWLCVGGVCFLIGLVVFTLQEAE